MCGILGIYQKELIWQKNDLASYVIALSKLIAHRGPDDHDFWVGPNNKIALAHQRLSIIDTHVRGKQPMFGENGTVITYNGEIYNYKELREELKDFWTFKTNTDTEVILALYAKYGQDCVDKLRGMFAFAIWDEAKQELFCARDRFGIKPFYYISQDRFFAFASEAKALLPLLDSIETDADPFAEYIVFQYTLGEQTMFKGIKTLLPGHSLTIKNGTVSIKRYWTLEYHPDYYHTAKHFYENFAELINESIALHLRSDVPVGCYLSGGIDSSIVTLLANQQQGSLAGLFHGRFNLPGYDESPFAQDVAQSIGHDLDISNITSNDFQDNLYKLIYHLDFPIAGPGSFPQYMVSKVAAQKVKVILGGQGGDELFGGYARYLIAYFEQCISAAIDDTHHNGHFVVTPESIIPNLKTLKEYKPLIKQFWREGLFDTLDKRYFRLVNRMIDFNGEIDINALNIASIQESFYKIFNGLNVEKASYFDKMTHFDLACLLPALLHVEDRVSMAHGLESRVPFLDHKVAEFVANIPADIKFKNGAMKHMLKEVFGDLLPSKLLNRRDKMGFPVPLKEWFEGELKDFAINILNKTSAQRPYFNKSKIMDNFKGQDFAFSRKLWGILSIELWYQNFHDKNAEFKNVLSINNARKLAI